MQLHRCGTPELAETPGTITRWPMSTITYFEALAFQGEDPVNVSNVYDAACAQWAAVAGLSFKRLSDPRGANVVAITGPIDGPYGILAQSDLPVGASAASVMQQLFDSAEPWYAEAPDLMLACMTHEIGHALGMSHIPNRNALLDPFVVEGRSNPQPPDVADIQSRYGLPFTSHPPDADLVALGASFVPYVLGPLADGLVAAAKQLDAGTSAAEADLAWRSNAGLVRDVAWERVVGPVLAKLAPSQRAAALRSIAKGVGSRAGG
jgi:hypothetical protein